MRRDAMKVLITDGIDRTAVEMLRKAHEVEIRELDPKGLLAAIPSYQALIVRSRTKVTKDVLTRGTHLKVVGRAGVGVDNIDVDEATARKIVVVNAPTASTVTVAELAGIRLVEKDELFRDADVLSIHAALTPETRGLVGASELAKMRRNAVLVNCARGEIIEEPALADALRAGTLSGAAIDVFAKEPPAGSPLLSAPNIVFTPHLGASTVEGQARAGPIVADRVLKVLEGRHPDFVLNAAVSG